MTVADAAGGVIVSARTATSLGGHLAMRPVDLAAQEDGRQFSWSGPATISFDGPPADFSRQLNNAFALRLDLRPDAIGSGPLTLSFAGARFDIAKLLRNLPQGQLSTVKIPLRCFADAGAQVTAVTSPLKLEGTAGHRLSLRHARLEAVGEPLACPS